MIGRRDVEGWRDERTLRWLYHERGFGTRKTGRILGTTGGTISKWLARLDIEARPSGGGVTPDELKDSEWVRREYKDKKRSSHDIADELGCASSTVSRYIRQHGIPLNDWGVYFEDFKVGGERYADIYSRVDAECAYCGAVDSVPQSRRDQEDQYFCGRECYGRWRSENRVGSGSPLWKGGDNVQYGIGWGEKKREAVRERDGRKCQHCGRSEKEHIELFDKKHCVHHIQPARSFDDPKRRNAMDNLVTLCTTCHMTWERMSPLKPITEAQL